jgi:hypothetical protein
MTVKRTSLLSKVLHVRSGKAQSTLQPKGKAGIIVIEGYRGLVNRHYYASILVASPK